MIFFPTISRRFTRLPPVRRVLSTAVITHSSFIKHRCGNSTHPESPERIQTLQTKLPVLFEEEINTGKLRWFDSDEHAPKATAKELVEAGHTKTYVEETLKVCQTALEKRRSIQLDGDTAVNQHTLEAALRAAGAAKTAVDLVLNDSNEINHTFCLVRPPGHHAEKSRSMGFCLFGNVAMAVNRAKKQLKKIVVFDFDVHHENGTQNLLWEDINTLFISTHQSPLYPGTGLSSEKGSSGSNVLNLPLPPNTSSDLYMDLIESVVVPTIKEWKPELIIFSAGFDAHQNDPLAQMNLTHNDYYNVTKQILDTMENGRSISVLEGGYDLAALCDSTESMLRALLDSK